MMTRFVKIISYDLVGESEDGSLYRHVIFEDLSNNRSSDYIVNKNQRPALWTDIERIEKGKVLPPMKGYIESLKEINIVVLGDESLQEAFEYQRWKLDKQKKLSRTEADRMRKNTKGYFTDASTKNSLEYCWNSIPAKAKKIKFRFYTGKGTFSWSNWFEIKE
jgi:hypothetical protein